MDAPIKGSLFVKKLSAVDAFITQSIKLPRSEVQRIVGRLRQRQSATIVVTDESQRRWELLCTCHESVYALSRIGHFCEAHDLHPGNYMTIYRDCQGKLRVYTSVSYPKSLLSAAVSAEQALGQRSASPPLDNSSLWASPTSSSSIINEFLFDPTQTAPQQVCYVSCTSSQPSLLKHLRSSKGPESRQGARHHLARCTTCRDTLCSPDAPVDVQTNSAPEQATPPRVVDAQASDSPVPGRCALAMPNSPQAPAPVAQVWACPQPSKLEVQSISFQSPSPMKWSPSVQVSQAPARSQPPNRLRSSAAQAALVQDLVASGCSTTRARNLVRLHLVSGCVPEVVKLLRQKESRQSGLQTACKRQRTLLD